MNGRPRIQLESEAFLMLLKDSLGSIPFNLILAVLLGVILIYNDTPIYLVILWLCAIFIISLVRWIYSKLAIKRKYYLPPSNTSLIFFLIGTCFMGLAWGSSFIIFLPYVKVSDEAIIILVLGGMSAGAIASLSVYLPVYYAYVLPMFLPVIVYNFYTLNINRVLLGLMYFLFVVMVFITAKINSRLFHENFKLGKEKDVLINELTQMNLKLESSIREVNIMSITDSLTGLYNRRYFDLVFNNELERSQREKYAINLVLIDIDNFKYINDTFGHPCGDEFLIYVANSLKHSIHRHNESVFRLGGDEFALILANMPPDSLLPFCQSIQKRFNNNNQYPNVTLSMSLISAYSGSVLDMQTIITIADKTLYQAKKEGKNKIISKIIT